MKLVGYFLGACVVLAIVRALVLALAVVLGLAIVLGAMIKPRETFGILLFTCACGVIQAYPTPCVITAVVVAIISVRIRNRRRPS